MINNLKTECIKGYFPESVADEIRKLARKHGMSTSHFIRAVVDEKIRQAKILESNNIVNFNRNL